MGRIKVKIVGESNEKIVWELPYDTDLEMGLNMAITEFYKHIIKSILMHNYGFRENEVESITLTYYQDAFMVVKNNKTYIVTFCEIKNDKVVFKHPKELVVEIYETE